MSIEELEQAVANLSPLDLSSFKKWFASFAGDAWDREFEQDVKAGRLDSLAAEADRDFESGNCSPL